MIQYASYKLKFLRRYTMIRRVFIFNKIFINIVVLSVILYANDFIGVKYINLLQVLSILSSLVLAIMYEKNYKGLKSTKRSHYYVLILVLIYAGVVIQIAKYFK